VSMSPFVPHARPPIRASLMPRTSEPATLQPASETKRHTSAPLRRLLREIEDSGSGSQAFWRLFWASVPRLRESDLERLLPAVGDRGDAHFAAVNERLARGR
jgi:hypothetical protein